LLFSLIVARHPVCFQVAIDLISLLLLDLLLLSNIAAEVLTIVHGMVGGVHTRVQRGPVLCIGVISNPGNRPYCLPHILVISLVYQEVWQVVWLICVSWLLMAAPGTVGQFWTIILASSAVDRAPFG
jgi:hypothetical protein